jgi:hypothetical protein
VGRHFREPDVRWIDYALRLVVHLRVLYRDHFKLFCNPKMVR